MVTSWLLGILFYIKKKKIKKKIINNKFLKYLKNQPCCFAFKEFGGLYGTAGIPDVLCCYNGKFVAFEVKTPNGKLSKLQEIILQKIQNANGIACKVTSLDEVKEILKNLEVK